MWMTEEIKMDKKKKTPKQIAALVCVGLLVLLYVVTLVVACLNFPGADRLFQACLLYTSDMDGKRSVPLFSGIPERALPLTSLFYAQKSPVRYSNGAYRKNSVSVLPANRK